MRILNGSDLVSHGNQAGRQAVLEILEAGLQAADPYYNTRKLMRRQKTADGRDLLIVGGDPAYDPIGAPTTAELIFDLASVDRIYVLGAGKGVQFAAKAIEQILGDRLTEGHVIAKHGDDLICEKIKVTYGAHPVPDEGCVVGCQKIVEMCEAANFTERDIVLTISANGMSSLMTLPVPGVSLEDVRQTTYMMQIERGTPTGDLNTIRNHLDVLKGGRVTRLFQPAFGIHILAIDPGEYDQLIHRNLWLHPLPEGSTYADALRNLKKWDALESVPQSVREFIERADSTQETMKAEEFLTTRHRIFGVVPNSVGLLVEAMNKAEQLGFKSYHLAAGLRVEASQAGAFVGVVGLTVQNSGEPFQPPCALFTNGELLVTVGKENGIGGRNQEYALAAAIQIAGSQNVVIGAVDSDGTDGPGTQFNPEVDCPSLAGAIVDGTTLAEAISQGIDLQAELKRHNTSPALCKLGSGIIATHNISVNDLGVTLVLGPSQPKRQV